MCELRNCFALNCFVSSPTERKKAPSTSSDGSGNGGGASGSGTRRGIDQLDQQQQQLTKQTPKPATSKPQYDEEIEDWCLSEVVFVEDGRTQPVGVLLKIDGTIAAVKFLKEQDRACLAAHCPSAPVCLFINQITKTAPALQKPFVAPLSASSSSSSSSLVAPHDPMAWLNVSYFLRLSFLSEVFSNPFYTISGLPSVEKGRLDAGEAGGRWGAIPARARLCSADTASYLDELSYR